MKKFIMIISINSSSPEARAKRLKYIREHLLDVTRDEMCSKFDLSVNTLKSWELALHGGLTEKGAEKIALLLNKFGFYCTSDWILHDIGLEPVKHSLNMQIHEEEDKQIAKELLEFRKQKDAIDTIVRDDGMTPFLYPGNYVAGIKTDLITATGRECIIVTEHNELFLRVLKRENNGLFSLICHNKNSCLVKPEIKNIKIVLAAPIIWIRKHIPTTHL